MSNTLLPQRLGAASVDATESNETSTMMSLIENETRPKNDIALAMESKRRVHIE